MYGRDIGSNYSGFRAGGSLKALLTDSLFAETLADKLVAESLVSSSFSYPETLHIHKVIIRSNMHRGLTTFKHITLQ